MKEITRYESVNGKIFESMEECLKYEKLHSLVEEIRRKMLPKEYDTVDFANGHGFIQLPPEARDGIEGMILSLSREYLPGVKSMLNGLLGRILSDSTDQCSFPLYHLWTMMEQIDDAGRLWGQPYFAHKGYGRGDSICLHTVKE